MAASGDRTIHTLGTAAVDLRTTRHHILRFTGAATMDIASHAAATAVLGAVGVQENKANSGQAVSVVERGITQVVAGGSITVNVLVTNNSSGRATAATSGDLVVGRALQAAGADGDKIQMLACQPYPLLRS